jgi:hypothetical protein
VPLSGADDYLGQTLFVLGAVGTDPGAAATLPSAGGIRADGGRLEARPGRTQGRARGVPIDLTSKKFALLDGRLWLIPSQRQQ